MEDTTNISGAGMNDANDNGVDNQNQNNENKTYTQEELDAIVQREADKRVQQAMETAKRKNDARVREAEKLAKMNADQRYQYELEQREAAIAAKEAELALAENKAEASKILAERGLSVDFIKFVVAENADDMMENIKTIEKAFNASVKREVEKRLGGGSPKKGADDGKLTKEQFNKLSIAELTELKNSNPELYNEMRSK